MFYPSLSSFLNLLQFTCEARCLALLGKWFRWKWRKGLLLQGLYIRRQEYHGTKKVPSNLSEEPTLSSQCCLALDLHVGLPPHSDSSSCPCPCSRRIHSTNWVMFTNSLNSHFVHAPHPRLANYGLILCQLKGKVKYVIPLSPRGDVVMEANNLVPKPWKEMM